MASLHSLMSETAKVELSRLPDFIEECSMLYMPHLGYLLGVKAWEENLTMEQKELPNMKFMVSVPAGSTVNIQQHKILLHVEQL